MGTLSMIVLLAQCVAAEPLYQEELIFPLQEKHVHSSSIVECPNGDLLACWFHGSGERKSPDVEVLGARRANGAPGWSEVFPMADTPGFPDCNPVLFVDPEGSLWLFWIAVLAESWEDSLLRYRKTSDFQEPGPPRWQWQDDMLFDPGKDMPDLLRSAYDTLKDDLKGLSKGAKARVDFECTRILRDAMDMSKRERGWMTRCHPLVLPSGRILLPLYSDGFLLGLMAISDDNGKSWRPSKPIPGVVLNQPSIARKRDGTLVAYMREEDEIRHRALISTSSDDGETWSVARWTDIPNPNASLEVLGLKDGRWVLVYNDSETSRDTLVIALSDDEGATWKWKRHLDRKEGGSFHYPFAMQARDGAIHITYTYQPEPRSGKSIKHVTLDPSWIVAGD